MSAVAVDHGSTWHTSANPPGAFPADQKGGERAPKVYLPRVRLFFCLAKVRQREAWYWEPVAQWYRVQREEGKGITVYGSRVRFKGSRPIRWQWPPLKEQPTWGWRAREMADRILWWRYNSMRRIRLPSTVRADLRRIRAGTEPFPYDLLMYLERRFRGWLRWKEQLTRAQREQGTKWPDKRYLRRGVPKLTVQLQGLKVGGLGWTR
jgi:hypothetical protein